MSMSNTQQEALADFGRWKDALEKHIANGRIEDAKVILGVLEKCTTRMSAEILRKTKIGICLNDVRKNASLPADVRDIAKILILEWKQMIAAGSAPTKSTPASENNLKSVNGLTSVQQDTKELAVGVNGTAVKRKRDDPPPAIDTAKAAVVDEVIVQRTVATDEIEYNSSGNKMRDKCTEMLYTSLATASKVDGNTIILIAQQIERTVYNENGKKADAPAYKSRIRTLYANLKANADLRSRILSKSLAPEYLAVMSTEAMMSKERKAEVALAVKESMQEAVSAQDNQSETDMFKCGRCKQRKTKYYQMQTRSADEPMTTFVTCVGCGNKWKFC